MRSPILSTVLPCPTSPVPWPSWTACNSPHVSHSDKPTPLIICCAMILTVHSTGCQQVSYQHRIEQDAN